MYSPYLLQNDSNKSKISLGFCGKRRRSPTPPYYIFTAIVDFFVKSCKMVKSVDTSTLYIPTIPYILNKCLLGMNLLSFLIFLLRKYLLSKYIY